MEKPSFEQLHQWYIIEKRSYRWIMDKTGSRSARVIKIWLCLNNIPIRKGSEAVATQWINNPERKKKTSEKAKESFKDFWGRKSFTPEQNAEINRKISESKIGSKNPMYGIKGKDNHAFLGGKKTWTKGRKIKKKRKIEIKNILGNKCEKCGKTDGLTIHHDPPWRICRSHDLKFLHLLCKNCHFSGSNEKR